MRFCVRCGAWIRLLMLLLHCWLHFESSRLIEPNWVRKRESMFLFQLEEILRPPRTTHGEHIFAVWLICDFFLLPAKITLSVSCLLKSDQYVFFLYEFVLHIELLLILRSVWVFSLRVNVAPRCFHCAASDFVFSFLRRADIDSRTLLPPGSEEIKDGQWMGVTVRSQGRGGKVLVSVRFPKLLCELSPPWEIENKSTRSCVLFSCLVIIKMPWIWYTLIGGLKCQRMGLLCARFKCQTQRLNQPKKSTLRTHTCYNN